MELVRLLVTIVGVLIPLSRYSMSNLIVGIAWSCLVPLVKLLVGFVELDGEMAKLP